MLADFFQSAGGLSRVFDGRFAKEMRFSLLGLDEFDDDADVDEQENEKWYAVDEDQVAVSIDDGDEKSAREFSRVGLVVGLIGDRILDEVARDLEPFGRVVEDTEQKDAKNGGQSVAHCANLVGLERPSQIDPAIDGDSTGQIDGVELKGGEQGTDEADGEIDEALVRMHGQHVVALGTDALEFDSLAEIFGRNEISERVEDNVAEQADDVGDGESGEIDVC